MKQLTLNELKEKAAKFSDKQFGKNRGAALPLIKLIEETAELTECIVQGVDDPIFEYADCVLVIIDSFRKYYGDDIDMQMLIDACSNKLDLNFKREWGYDAETGTFKHIKKYEKSN